MRGLHILSFEKPHRDAVLDGGFVGAGFVRANEVARETIVYNGSDAVAWFEGGN